MQALKQKGVSPYCIKTGLKEIDEDDYEQTLQKLFTQKWESLKGTPNRFVKMKKTTDYLLQKGFEPHLINRLFNASND
ncbi:RecX family transcriptional regulator [Niabella sp. W65]|nr:RecX family transcriptional regulator [Niabella sp. W65]MCH7368965.1 RecX family transcriptional regulator [Niabella sp. W65]